MNLKNKTVSGLFWVFAEQIGNKLVQFIIGIVLARLLLPSQFGLIGMITVFISISETIAMAGFVQALIRKNNCTDDDFNTAFIFNLSAAIFLYLILFLSAPSISAFFKEKELVNLVRAVSLAILFDAISFVQRARLYKELNFKALAQATIISQIISGIIGVIAAFMGYGVWSLVLKIVLNRLIMSINLVIINKWIPRLKLSRASFRELFSFGSKILATQIIESAYANIYQVVIGRFFSATEVGYYTRANMFKSMVSEQLVTAVQRVTLPVLSSIQENQEKLVRGFTNLTKLVFFVSVFSLIGFVPISKSMILFLLGAKWQPSIIYLQLLAVSAILYPIGEINLNILQVKGRSDYILWIQIAKKMLSIPLIVIGVIYGIKYLIIGIIFTQILNFIANSFFSKRFIGYSSWQQIAHSLPSLLIITGIAALTLIVGTLLHDIPVGWIFVAQVLFYLGASIGIFELIKKQEYMEIKKITLDYMQSFMQKKLKKQVVEN